MLPLSLRTIRLTLHILGVTVWVGGQITLLGLLPVLRAAGGDVPRQFARQFNRIAWPAFGVALVTGIWNVGAVDMTNVPDGYHVTLLIKLLLVAASGVGAFLHGRAATPAAKGIWGAVGLFTAVAAVLLGVLLAG
jgi:putative copper export protein